MMRNNNNIIPRLLVVMISAIVAGVAFVSCQQDLPISRPPEYEKPLLFTLDDPQTVTFYNQNNVRTISSCRVGDTVTVYLPTVYTGTYIYKATYKWTTESELIPSETIEQSDPCAQDSLPPKWTFVAPQTPGQYDVYFRASYSYSALTENGQAFGAYPVGRYDKKSSVHGVLEVKQ